MADIDLADHLSVYDYPHYGRASIKASNDCKLPILREMMEHTFPLSARTRHPICAILSSFHSGDEKIEMKGGILGFATLDMSFPEVTDKEIP